MIETLENLHQSDEILPTDFGFRFEEWSISKERLDPPENGWKCIGEEQEAIPATKFFFPVISMNASSALLQAQEALRSYADLAFCSATFLQEEILEDNKIMQTTEKFNPYKGNVFDIFQLAGKEYMAFAAGERLSELYICSLDTAPFILRDSKNNRWNCDTMPMGNIILRSQISASPAWNLVGNNKPCTNVIGVRTTDGTAIIRIKTDTTKENDELEAQRWRSCVFGATARVIIVASVNKVELINYRSVVPQRYTIYEPPSEQRIYALGMPSLPHRNHVYIATTEEVLLIDARYPGQPVAQWAHHMNDKPPTFIEPFPLSSVERKCADTYIRILAGNSQSNRFLVLQYKYDGKIFRSRPNSKLSTKSAPVVSRPRYLILKEHYTQYSSTQLCIPSAGTKILKKTAHLTDTHPAKEIFVYFRMLDNGALYVQLFEEIEKNASLDPETRLFFVNDPVMQETLCREAKENETEARSAICTSWKPLALVQDLVTRNLALHLPLWRDKDHRDITDVTEKAIQESKKIEQPATLTELVGWNPSLGLKKADMKEIDSVLRDQEIALGQKINSKEIAVDLENVNQAFGETLQKQDNVDDQIAEARESTREALNELFAQELAASMLTYIPSPTTGKNKLRYFLSANKEFRMTASAALLAREWDVSVPKDEPIAFGEQKVLGDHDLLPAYTYERKKRARLDMADEEYMAATQPYEPMTAFTSLPTMDDLDLPQPPSFVDIASQPLPGAFALRKSAEGRQKTKKKKPKTKGFK
ncbi:hypothetical protein DFQ28_011450 [Apophysomyces sp. BC1034]|nr:hypothetical protein DFQ28_011450 [Apophysomyces sp. BC1034]